MKKLFLQLALFYTVTANATIRTVSNNPLNPAQYSTIQLAITAANAGDTVYVHPSPNFYAAFVLDKQLTIIGGGFEAAGSNPYKDTRIDNSLGATNELNNINASGSKIIALWFASAQINFTVFGIHDITISRCRFDNCFVNFMTNMFNVTVSENVFFEGGLGFNAFNGAGTANNFLIANNIFRHSYGTPSFYYWAGVTNTIATNNLFYSGGAFDGKNNRIAENSSGISFSNNIFNRIDFSTLSNCTFSNCLTYACNTNTPWINNGTDIGNAALGTQNVANTLPVFENEANINAGGYGSVNWFEVTAGSPILSSMAGDPGMGPYFGATYDFRNAGASKLPYVSSVKLQNTTVQAGNTITVSVEAKTKN